MGDTVIRWLAKNAFFDYSKADIEDIMEHESKPVNGKALLKVLVASLMNVLSVSEAKAMDMVKKRVVAAKANRATWVSSCILMKSKQT